jgi:selenide,water dikinase
MKTNGGVSESHMKTDSIRLTQFSPAAGCGCKLSPDILRRILSGVETGTPENTQPSLLVGNDSRDDSAAVDIGNGRALLSTTDFFTPIVDDPREFGEIAATNAISDIYAMGGTPTVAIAILGWPVDKLAPEVAREVLSGARAICSKAGITLAGGHSIDISEPIFGLAVSGLVDIDHLRRNDSAIDGDALFLTKPLGVGIISTAGKRARATQQDLALASESMRTLNKIGAELSSLEGVTAMTDVTGFGLAGHLTEMMRGSGLDASIDWSAIPTIGDLETYITEGCVPGGTDRNFGAIAMHLPPLTDFQRAVLCDPQTSGGLLIAVRPEARDEIASRLNAAGLPSAPIGDLSIATSEQPKLTICA